MLPKVATHILHTTSRAAASIQHQTYTIRNVLQLQSSSGPSSGSGNLAPWNSPGSSHWGNNGPGPGGAKYNAGSRFHSGYTGAARAVTQASNTIASNDGSFSHPDETEDLSRRVSAHPTKRTRIRSHSLSIPVQGRGERADNLGVLKTVQLHTRSRHVFAPASSSEGIISESPSSVIDANSRPALVRRNSTSVPLISPDSFDTVVSAPSPVLARRNSTSASSNASADSFESHLSSPASTAATQLSFTDPAAPQTLEQPTAETFTESEAYVSLREARHSGDTALAAEAVRNFRKTAEKPTIQEFNMAIDALLRTRPQGEPLRMILDTYNDLLRHSLVPNLRTYKLLIDALTVRDYEVQRLTHTLEVRLKRRQLAGRPETVTEESDRLRIETLRAENNFPSAMSLFQTIVSLGKNHMVPFSTYTYLLRSAAYHSNIDSAIHVFAQLEKRSELRPNAQVFTYLIQVYTNAGEISGAEEIFQEFLNRCKAGTVEWAASGDPEYPRRSQLLLWNQMIEAYFRCGMPEKAIDLVDQMMNTTATRDFGPTDVPPTASSTFTTVLSGFCQMGDVPTALLWFDRLLQQKQANDDPFEMVGTAMKPDFVAWSIMLDALAVHGMVDDLNRIYAIRLTYPGYISAVDRSLVLAANLAKIQNLDAEQTKKTLEFLARDVVQTTNVTQAEHASFVKDILDAYLSKGLYEHAVSYLVNFASLKMAVAADTEAPSGDADIAVRLLQNTQLSFTRQLYEKSQGNLPFSHVLQVARVADVAKVMQQEEFTPFFLHSYGLSRKSGTLPLNEMTTRDWELILYAAVAVDTAATEGRSLQDQVPQYAFEGIVPLLQDVAQSNVQFDQMQPDLVRRIIKLVSFQNGTTEAKAIFDNLGPSFQALANDPELQTAAPAEAIDNSSEDLLEIPPLKIDTHYTRFIEEILQKNTSTRSAVLKAYKRFTDGVDTGVAPTPLTIGRLIQSLGRLGEIEHVRYAYTVAQSVLKLLSNQSWQANSWFLIEDSMVIALAHFGDVDAAHVHRMRILEQGGAPTADAYGALILYVKDTTDDTSNAMALFQESQARGVTPNLYLYNNIISKLAKARKADYALELFQQMKANHIRPSSITYGAVIGACARVGDSHSAEALFEEMVQARNFKPRVPPYNTMMQMYTTTKPNRERALHFYQELIRAGVTPTAHTYKLLMDAYGAVEPVDIQSMEQVFETLQQDMTVEIQGNHFSTLINAYGCIQKDLDKAIQIFDSIPSYPRAQAVDAVVFEAMINVLVANRRTDLIPDYISKMNVAGVHMTAYIANFIIKGYAMVGDLEHARSIFESLADPPQGMAAPNNHAPHEPGNSPIVNHMEPVYREPSTWEAMVRAELGSGNRQEAANLLERLRARQYPEAVYNRISGIMVDHSMVLQ